MFACGNAEFWNGLDNNQTGFGLRNFRNPNDNIIIKEA